MSRWKMTRNIGRELVTDSARRASRESRAPGSGARRAHQTRCDIRWPQASGRKTYKQDSRIGRVGRTDPFFHDVRSPHAGKAGWGVHLLCLFGRNDKDVGRMTRKHNTILEVRGLHIRRGQTTILESVSWRVECGQHWAMLGANGSGKTSLLSALTGYLTPSRGEIMVLDQRYGETDWRELRKQIGLVSSSVRQMMPEFESALETVVSGKYAMIDFWGKVRSSDRVRAGRILEQIEC